ncbi:response regulator transcription factor [Metabacillus sp. Hm71]|uniref:response regulator transcription factor n=1 Tax=Metabacillus sp. Hm71 TaxID=3450743 RepID=UPI003F4414E6
MFNVMIVDDEPTTRQGLVNLVPWEKYGFQVTDTAANGNEAIEKFHIASPNLMIVDIRIPGLSGIELIEKIAEMNTNVYFLILSEHAEFECAKKAMKYNVKGYLLKPLDENEMIHYLLELKPMMEKELEYRKLEMKIDQENKERFIQAVLNGEQPEEIKGSKFYVQWTTYRLLLVKAGDQCNADSMMLKKNLKGFFENNNIGIVFSIKNYYGILLNAELEFSKHHDDIYRVLKVLMNDCQLPFTAAISTVFEDIQELPTAFQATNMLIAKQFFFDDGAILSEHSKPVLLDGRNDLKEERNELNLTYGVETLLFAMEIGDRDAIERICMRIGWRMIEAGYTENDSKKHFIHIVSSLIHKLMYQYHEIRGELSNVLFMVYEIENQRKIKQLLTYVNGLIAEILEKMDVDKTGVLVKKMIHLIEKNYDKNIKLETLSELLHYNRTYLGKLFKSYTGEHFNTYLDKVRIENAKKLLLQGYKVYEVSKRTGFSNVNYFHFKFRNYVGMSPSAYRKEKLME